MCGENGLIVRVVLMVSENGCCYINVKTKTCILDLPHDLLDL